MRRGSGRRDPARPSHGRRVNGSGISCPRAHRAFGHHQRAAGTRAWAHRIGAGDGRHHGAAARATATGVEGSGAAGGARDQEPTDAHRSERRAHRQASGARPAGIAEHYPQVQRGDSGLRGHVAHAGRSVLVAGAVSRAAAPRLLHESDCRRSAGAVRRQARGHHGAARSRAWPARGDGRSRGHPPRARQFDRQRGGSHAGQFTARARRTAPRWWKTARPSRSPSPTPATA